LRWYRINGMPNASDFSGNQSQIFRVKIQEDSICVLLKNQKVYAFREECPHAGKSLLHSRCDHENEITCLAHNFKFSLEDGKCTSHNEGYRLQLLQTKTESNGDVLIYY